MNARAGGLDPRTAGIVGALVERGIVDPQRAGEADAVVRSALDSSRAAVPAPVRRRLAEVSGYVGGTLLVAAAVIFLLEEWVGLTTGGRLLTLAAIALVLAASAVAVVVTGRRGTAGAGAADQGVRRRLASALSCGAAGAVAFAAGVLVDDRSQDFSSAPWLAGSVALVLVAAAGYRLAPSALGQLTMAVGGFSAISATLETFAAPSNEVTMGLAVLALGAVWLVLAELGVWLERYTGLAIGCALALAGAQFPVLGSDHETVGYLLTAAVAAVAIVLYLRRRTTPYLVAAVVGLTVAVPEALLDWTEGSLGPVGALLVTGVTLLVASLLGLRLRQEIGEDPVAP